MTEFIGARISLISKSNIRYVGILHEINSETSTVALEQVVSHGTEGRRNDPSQEIAGSDNVYEYIVFRGSDVKDLRIEEQPKPQPPPQLDDPAILGSSRPPQAPFPQNQFQAPPPMQPPYGYYPPPQQQRFGPGPGPGPYGHPGAMYGGFPPGPGGPMGPPGPGMQGPPPMGHPQQGGIPPQQQQQQQQGPQNGQQQSQQQAQQASQAPQQQQPPTGPQNRAPAHAPIGPAVVRQGPQPGATRNASGSVSQEAMADGAPQAAPKTENVSEPQGAQTPSRAVPTGPKARGGIVPAVPLMSPARVASKPVTASTPAQAQSASQSATDAIQDLSNKVNRLAVGNAQTSPTPASASPETIKSENASANAGPRPRQPGGPNFATRGNRNNSYRNAPGQTRKVEVPATDYDFESANAKFNKQDLVKEVIASGEDESVAVPEGAASASTAAIAVAPQSPAANGNANVEEPVVIPPPAGGFYNKSSFFDNISCENKERAEGKDQQRPRGAAFRTEEQKKNLETFGQGSVDGYGYRGGWRGRGRGRGYGRGRGGSAGGYNTGYGGPRGGFRSPQGQQATTVINHHQQQPAGN